MNASTINGLVNCTIDTANSNIVTPPNLGAKQVEVCHVLQPGNSESPILRNAISPVPPPPYDKPPLQDPTAGRSEKVSRLDNSNQINKPTITPSSHAAHPAHESPEAARHSPAYHPYRDRVTGLHPSTNIAPPQPTSLEAGEFGGIDLSGYDFEFPESLGDETMDLIAAVDLGVMDAGFNANFNRRLHANKPVKLGDVTQSNMDEDVGVEVDVRSNASSNNQPLFHDEPNKPSSDRVADKFFSRGSSPMGRLPSFSRFDAIPSDCAGCCLHPPTQRLASQCRSRTASPASSPPETGILRIQSPGAHVSPTRVQTPSGLNTPTKSREEVNSRPASFTALNEILTPSQNLKRPITADKTHNTYRKLLEIQSHNLNMQSHNLKMQMALNEILMDELDTWASSKRQKL